MAQLEGDADRVMYLLSEEAAAAASATVNKFNYKQPKTTQQVRAGARRAWGWPEPGWLAGGGPARLQSQGSGPSPFLRCARCTCP